jgi:AraC family transcriptional regulator of arabinose operon
MKTERVFEDKEDLGLVLKYCGVEYCSPDFIMYPHRRDEYLIHYVFHGAGVFRQSDQEHSLARGNVFVILPQEVISYAANHENPLHFCWIGFSGRNAKRLIEMIGFSIKEPVLTLNPDNEILDLITRCVQLCDSHSSSADLEIQAILYKIFNIILIKSNQGIFKNNNRDNKSASRHVMRAKSYIQLNYMKPLTIEKIAQQINLDRTYLSKIFSGIEKISLHSYLTSYRIESAKRLLLETSFCIQEIGNMVGISDAYHFSRMFKKYTGLAPSVFRRVRLVQTKSCPIVEISNWDVY